MSEVNPIEAMVSGMRATADMPEASSLLEEFCGWGADRDFVALARAALTSLSENITVEMVEELADLTRSNVPPLLLKSRIARAIMVAADSQAMKEQG